MSNAQCTPIINCPFLQLASGRKWVSCISLLFDSLLMARVPTFVTTLDCYNASWELSCIILVPRSDGVLVSPGRCHPGLTTNCGWRHHAALWALYTAALWESVEAASCCSLVGRGHQRGGSGRQARDSGGGQRDGRRPRHGPRVARSEAAVTRSWWVCSPGTETSTGPRTTGSPRPPTTPPALSKLLTSCRWVSRVTKLHVTPCPRRGRRRAGRGRCRTTTEPPPSAATPATTPASPGQTPSCGGPTDIITSHHYNPTCCHTNAFVTN